MIWLLLLVQMKNTLPKPVPASILAALLFFGLDIFALPLMDISKAFGQATSTTPTTTTADNSTSLEQLKNRPFNYKNESIR